MIHKLERGLALGLCAIIGAAGAVVSFCAIMALEDPAEPDSAPRAKRATPAGDVPFG